MPVSALNLMRLVGFDLFQYKTYVVLCRYVLLCICQVFVASIKCVSKGNTIVNEENQHGLRVYFKQLQRLNTSWTLNMKSNQWKWTDEFHVCIIACKNANSGALLTKRVIHQLWNAPLCPNETSCSADYQSNNTFTKALDASRWSWNGKRLGKMKDMGHNLNERTDKNSKNSAEAAGRNPTVRHYAIIA